MQVLLLTLHLIVSIRDEDALQMYPSFSKPQWKTVADQTLLSTV